MRQIQTQFATFFLLISSLLLLSSCEIEIDDWDDWDIPQSVIGTWRVTDSRPIDAYYQPDDVLEFHHGGEFRSYGPGLQAEYGIWNITSRRIYIKLDSQPGHDPDMVCRVVRFDGNHMVLDVNDYADGMNYTLYLVRDYFTDKKDNNFPAIDKKDL